jgi:hypothetical protein
MYYLLNTLQALDQIRPLFCSIEERKLCFKVIYKLFEFWVVFELLIICRNMALALLAEIDLFAGSGEVLTILLHNVCARPRIDRTILSLGDTN